MTVYVIYNNFFKRETYNVNSFGYQNHQQTC